MALEIEAKLAVTEHETVRARLRELGATPAGSVHELNQFFDTPDHSLRSADKGLRLRANTNITTGTARHVVTVKGPRQPGALKSRPEHEFEVSDPQSAAAAFALLGFQPELSFEKRRETWHIHGLSIELDELPHIGRFVEIEGPSAEAVTQLQHALGLGSATPLQESYIAMLTQYAAQHHLTGKHMPLPPTA